MKRILLILALSSSLFAQSFPTSVYTPLVAKDNIATTLTTAMAAGDTTAFVKSTTGWVVNMVAYICDSTTSTSRCTGTYEAMLVTAVPGVNALTVTRGYGGTTGIAHANGKAILNAPASVYHTSTNNEVHAIEVALGANMANILSGTLPVTHGPTTGANIPGADAPYTAPSVLAVRAGTSASPNTTATPGFVFQMANAEPSNIAQGAVFDCYSTSAARYGFSGGCITTTNVLHDLTIAKGGVANRNLVYADAPPAVSTVASAVNAAGTITVTTGTAHYASTGEAVIIAGTAGMANLNATVASVTVTSPTTFTFACGGCGAGPAGAAGTVTVPTVYYGSWDSIFKVSGPQLRIVGHESDMNNQYADAGDNVGAQDATFNYALYCSSHNCTTGMYMNSGDAAGKYYFPLKFGSNALVAGYPYIDSSTGPSTVDFAWIGNNQPLRWADSLGGRWPILFLSTGDSTFLSAPTGGVINIGPNVTNVVDVSATVLSNRQSTVLAKATNYIASETGANNAIAGALVDALAVAVPLATGLRVTVKLGHTLQAGANTFNLNAGGAVAIKSGRNVANNIGTAYAATGVVTLFYDGTEWVDVSQ